MGETEPSPTRASTASSRQKQPWERQTVEETLTRATTEAQKETKTAVKRTACSVRNPAQIAPAAHVAIKKNKTV